MPARATTSKKRTIRYSGPRFLGIARAERREEAKGLATCGRRGRRSPRAEARKGEDGRELRLLVKVYSLKRKSRVALR